MSDVIREKIKRVLVQFAPVVKAHGGGFELQSYEKGVVTIKIKGACVGCPMARATFHENIGRMIKEKVKEVKEINYV